MQAQLDYYSQLVTEHIFGKEQAFSNAAKTNFSEIMKSFTIKIMEKLLAIKDESSERTDSHAHVALSSMTEGRVNDFMNDEVVDALDGEDAKHFVLDDGSRRSRTIRDQVFFSYSMPNPWKRNNLIRVAMGCGWDNICRLSNQPWKAWRGYRQLVSLVPRICFGKSCLILYLKLSKNPTGLMIFPNEQKISFKISSRGNFWPSFHWHAHP